MKRLMFIISITTALVAGTFAGGFPAFADASYEDLSGIDIWQTRAHGETNADTGIIEGDLLSRGATITQDDKDIIALELDKYDILWIEDFGDLEWTEAELDTVEAWVEGGGGILFHADQIGTATAVSNLFGMDQDEDAETEGNGTTTDLNSEHYIISDEVNTLYVHNRASALYLSSPADSVANDTEGVPIVAVAEVGAGRVVFIGDDMLWDGTGGIGTADNRIMANRAFDWLAGWDGSGSSEASEVAVPLDIKPTSCPNPLNVKSKGVLPVAILGTESLDVTTINPESILLEGVEPLRWDLEDVAAPYGAVPEDCDDCTEEGSDGYMDLTLKFDKQEIVAALGEVDDGDCLPLTLTGELNDETPISGVDWVWILNKGR